MLGTRWSSTRAWLEGLAAICVACCAVGASAQDSAPPVDLVGAQRAAMSPLAQFDGLWRGTGWALVDGKQVARTVTLRVGMALEGATQFIEIRSFDPDGSLAFHAFNNIAFAADQSRHVIQARAEGRFGDFPLRTTADGYVWDLINNGRGLRYVGTLRDGVWTEVTQSIAPDREPQVISEFKVSRVGDTDWPAGGAMRP